MLKNNKNKGRKKKRGKKHKRRKKMRGGKKKNIKVNHPVSNWRPNDREARALPIAPQKTLKQALGNLCYI